MFSPPVATPPWTKLGKKLESACRKALFDYKMVEGQQKIALALSGGKDSLTLLFLLHAISGRGFPPFEIIPIHVGGPFSCGASLEASFLKGICDKLQLPLHIVESKKERKLECYSCARERRRLIFDAAKESGCHTIAFGHHSDDNAQTLLMNLLHKGEFAGMLPKIEMVHFGVTLIRPLIYIKEKDLITFSHEHKYARITCQCPVGATSKRKKTDNLLTHLEEFFPNARQNIARSSLIYGSSKAAMES